MTMQTSPPTGNLKDRIAALQQPRGISPSPSNAPSAFKPGGSQPASAPKGSLRDKINKFERKGGVPIPRGSFGMGAPPPSDDGATKSRELYGNRIPSASKPKLDPLQPQLTGQLQPQYTGQLQPQFTGRSVASGGFVASSHVSSPSVSIASETFPFVDNTGSSNEEMATPLSPDVTGDPILSGPTPSRRSSTYTPRRRLSVIEIVESYDEVPTKAARRMSQTPSPADVSVISLQPQGETPTANKVDTGVLPTPPPSANAATPVSATVDVPGTKSAQLELPKVQRQTSNTPSASPSPSPVEPSPTSEVVKTPTPETTPAAPRALAPLTMPNISKVAEDTPASSAASSPASTPIATGPAVPLTVNTSAPPLAEPSLTPVPSRKSFTAVVHRRTSEEHPPRNSRSGPTVQRSTSNLKGDNTVVRSKRQFKHLAPVEQPPSPGAPDLADLLKEASWLEATLGNTTLDLSLNVPDDDEPQMTPKPTPEVKVTSPVSEPHKLDVKKSDLQTPPRMASRTPSPSSQPQYISNSTPSFHVQGPPVSSSEDLPPTPPPKSARTRRFFSMRSSNLRARQSMSSEMSSDESTPVATPPSPTSELSTLPDVRSIKSGGSTTSSLRISPRRGVARAASFADRLLNRQSKTKSMIEDKSSPVPEQNLYTLPSPIPETPRSLMSFSTTSSPGNNISFDFDEFPSVPSDIHPYNFETPSKTDHARPVTMPARGASQTKVPNHLGTGDLELGWLKDGESTDWLSLGGR
ncbi:hypothetical protein OF83DRAFT_1103268 [Amylostereum chailletii]|nr:hypothetical protein OF83DRAFT_1103268 [Amylostereum chailletii]